VLRKAEKKNQGEDNDRSAADADQAAQHRHCRPEENV
jgi:hypothetical protein